LTPLNKTFSYARLSGKFAIRALDQVREVYGVRRISLDENTRTVQVEYDASRLHADDVAALLSEAGIALLEWPPAAA
jgi:selenocysteine lyase/cysteine desulfurase